MADEKKPEQTPREIIAKLAEMSPDEFDKFMHWHFREMCKRPLPIEDVGSSQQSVDK